MDGETLEMLIQNFLQGKATPSEIEQLNVWYESFEGQKELYPPDLPGLAELVAENFRELKTKLGLE
jgi:hypothetical protein